MGFRKWRVYVLLGADVAADVASLREFNARMPSIGSGRRVVVESAEVKVASPEEVKRLSGIIPAELATYFEVPLSCGECIAAVAGCGRRAKVSSGCEAGDQFAASQHLV